MFGRFKEHKKYRMDIKSPEFILSTIGTMLITTLAFCVGAYDNLLILSGSIQSILSVFIGGYLALTGFALSGMAIITSLFTKDQLEVIEDGKPNSITDALASFEYLAFLSALLTALLPIIHIGFDLPHDLISNYLFYILLALIVFSMLYVLFYTVSLCGNCIRLYNISITAERIKALEKEIKELKSEQKQR